MKKQNLISPITNCQLPIARVKRSFTLIELVVVVGVLSILSAVAADMFINITRSYNKANIIAEIEQNGNLAISTMSNEIRSALSVSPTSGTASSIDIVDQDGAAVTFSFISPTSNDNGYIARNGLPIIDNERVTGVNVTHGMFTIVDADPPVVGITMTITQPKGVPGRIDYQAETTLKTSVSLRSYK